VSEPARVELSLVRSVLFAPAGEARKLRNALASAADAVVADLEDATAPGEKAAARMTVEAAWADTEPRAARGIRVNAPGSEWFHDDLELSRRLALDFLMLPKASPEALEALGPDGPRVLAIVETADGLRRAYETAAAPRVFAVALGSHDLGVELVTTARVDGLELLYARSKLVSDSAAAGLRPPFDTVFLDVRDPAGLEQEARLARTLGYRGKLCIHPGQLDVVNDVFSPSDAELDWARRVLDAHAAGVSEGRGVVALDGRMIDTPLVRRAQRLIAEAQRRGAAL
jgi:citrate lyase beta subunit